MLLYMYAVVPYMIWQEDFYLCKIFGFDAVESLYYTHTDKSLVS